MDKGGTGKMESAVISNKQYKKETVVFTEPTTTTTTHFANAPVFFRVSVEPKNSRYPLLPWGGGGGGESLGIKNYSLKL